MSALFLDVDTQLDFLYPAGALYVPGAEHLVPELARLNRYAGQNGIPLVSTVDAHTENDPEFRTWPKHCVAGTLGQQKAAATLVPGRVVIPNRPCDLAIDGAPQIVVEKQTVDIFQAPNFARILDILRPDSFVVYGVVTEICVLHAVRGLVPYGKPIVVVPGAIRSLTATANQAALDEMRSCGVRFHSPC